MAVNLKRDLLMERRVEQGPCARSVDDAAVVDDVIDRKDVRYTVMDKGHSASGCRPHDGPALGGLEVLDRVWGGRRSHAFSVVLDRIAEQGQRSRR